MWITLHWVPQATVWTPIPTKLADVFCSEFEFARFPYACALTQHRTTGN